MSKYLILAACAVITLGSLSQVQAQTNRREADMQRRHMREYLRYQRHYQQELQKREEALLEQDESLQFHYSESVISEGIYLEANAAYEKLEAAKLAQLPNAKAAQDAVLKVQKILRQPGKTVARGIDPGTGRGDRMAVRNFYRAGPGLSGTSAFAWRISG